MTRTWIRPGHRTHQMVAAAILLAAGALVGAQVNRQLDLRGDRFKPLTWDQLNPAQRTMVNDLLSGTRGTVTGPFNVLLRSPEMGNRAQKLGEYLRFQTTVPRRLNEMAILMTARWWSSQYEWHAHKPLALEAGLDAAVLEHFPAGAPPLPLTP